MCVGTAGSNARSNATTLNPEIPIVAVAAPAPSCTTLPILGFGCLVWRLAGIEVYVIGWEPFSRPRINLILAITDPANSSGASPAVQAAAAAKAEEDKAPQKIKAVSYLASLGCGKCYPDTENAILAALEDCTESVRYAAAKGLRKSVANGCGCCRQNSCCSPKLVKKLYEMGYDKDASGCYVEPSAR